MWLTGAAAAALCSLAARSAAQDMPLRAPARPAAMQAGLFGEPQLLSDGIQRISFLGSSSEPARDGLYPRIGGIVSGSRIAVGPGYRQHLLNGRLLFQASGAVSLRQYLAAEGRAEFSPVAGGPVTIGVQEVWQDLQQVHFFGSGAGSPASAVSEYQLRAADTSAYAILRAGRMTLGVRAGSLGPVRISAPGGWNDPGHPYTAEVFSSTTAPGLAGQTSFVHADAAVTVDTLDHRGHPGQGSMLALSAADYHDRQSGEFSFRRYEMDAAHFTPLVPKIWTLAVRGAAVFSDTVRGSQVPFYMLPGLGSDTGLRGFAAARFSGRDMSVATIESRWALWPHLDVALFADAGAVADTAAGLARAAYKRDLGFGIRLHTGPTTVVRLDLARGSEGWQVLFKTGESLRFSSIARWIGAIVPNRF